MKLLLLAIEVVPESESYIDLLKSGAHWGFELSVELITTVLIGWLIWPRLRKFFRHHADDDAQASDLESRVQALESALGKIE